MSAEGPYRDGRVHVLNARCSTCVFRPGNLMDLSAGRLAGMVSSALSNDSAITCHSTLYRDDVAPAICRGFADSYSTNPLRIAERLGAIVYDPAPDLAS